MTNHWIDIKNADNILIMGSNAAEHHPICFKWVLKAKEERGATLVHVDPKFSRTSAQCDFHVPLRSGTDIAFLGGMIKYILENEMYFKDYVLNYTNASFIVSKDFKFKNGLFSGFDPIKRAYDKSTWQFELDANGAPRKDSSLKDPNCVFQLLKKHYDRYNLDKVSDVTGVPKDELLKVYNAHAATGKPDKAGTVLYALGWTQHTVGVQNIRSSAIIQLLLGNIGIAGGGINALRGEPNVQGSTDHCILYHILPGYLALPLADWPGLKDYLKACTPVSKDPMSANWWGNYPKYMVSLLKGWYGDNATPENGYGYGWLPKGDKGTQYSYMHLWDEMYRGNIRGGSIWATCPAQSAPNTNKVRKSLANLDWLSIAEIHHNETTDFWHGPGMNPSTIRTEVFLMPSCHRVEKEGSVSNSGRWLLWHEKATECQGESKSMGQIMVEIVNHVRALYRKDSGVFPDPILKLDWPDYYDPNQMVKKINGQFTRETTVNGKTYQKGQQVPSFTALKDDGSTTSLNWLYSGSVTEEDGNKSKRRDLTQTPLQAKIGLFPNFSWCWPVNRRILYNRASVDTNGRPFDPTRTVIQWTGTKWEGDVPDGGWAPVASGEGRYPFIMQKEGYGQLFGAGRAEGPFPEHYEPIETPIKKNPFSKQLSNPCAVIMESDADALAKPGDERYPIVLTTYSMTEHWCGGGETRFVPALLEAEPQLYVEMSEELAKEKNIKNGDPVVVESARGRVEAIAMVTIRMRPFKIGGKTIHEIGMPFAFGWFSPGTGDATNRLTPCVGDPNTCIPEYKACCVNIKKADKVTELA